MKIFSVANSGLLINCNKKESDDVNKHIDKSLQKCAQAEKGETWKVLLLKYISKGVRLLRVLEVAQ